MVCTLHGWLALPCPLAPCLTSGQALWAEERHFHNFLMGSNTKLVKCQMGRHAMGIMGEMAKQQASKLIPKLSSLRGSMVNEPN